MSLPVLDQPVILVFVCAISNNQHGVRQSGGGTVWLIKDTSSIKLYQQTQVLYNVRITKCLIKLIWAVEGK